MAAAVTLPMMSAQPGTGQAYDGWVDQGREVLAAWRHLGSAKLYVLGALDPKTLARMGRHERHPIPGTDRAKTLEEMTIAELTLVVRAFSGRLNGIVQLDRFLRGHRRRLRGLVAPRFELPDRSRHVDDEMANELADAVVDAATALVRAFVDPG